MSELSGTQLIILTAAAQRPHRVALPLPESVNDGAAVKVVGAMSANGLLQEFDCDPRQGEPFWREIGEGHRKTLVATDLGLAAI